MSYTRLILVGAGVITVYLSIRLLKPRQRLVRTSHRFSSDLIRSLVQNPETAKQIQKLIKEVTGDEEFRKKIEKDLLQTVSSDSLRKEVADLLGKVVIECSQKEEVISALKNLLEKILSDEKLQKNASGSISSILYDMVSLKMR